MAAGPSKTATATDKDSIGMTAFLSAGRIAKDIAAGRVSAREITDAHIKRIEAYNDALNAVVVERFAAAREEARRADQMIAQGKSLGPLHGVPMTIKDSFDFAGLPSTFGHVSRRDHMAACDAVTVQRLRQAGAIVLGKTNVPKDLADWHSFNDVYGVTKNPWNFEHTPGGSSGGSAAALAAGLSALELGSDIAGSIRVPAAFCGIYGHKPTFGVIPMQGHGMLEIAGPIDILVAGPLARSAADLMLAFDVLRGPERPLKAGWQAQFHHEDRESLEGWRIALVTDDPDFPVDATLRDALTGLAQDLEAGGAIVDLHPELPISGEAAFQLFISLLRGATSGRLSTAEHGDVVTRAATFEAADTRYDALMHKGLAQSHHAWLQANDRRALVREGWRTFFETYDALLCPTTTTAAFPNMIGLPKIEQYVTVDGAKRPASDNYYWIGIPALSYLPATALPIGRTEQGLPLGAQIISGAFSDQTCLRLAHLIEVMRGPFIPPDAYA